MTEQEINDEIRYRYNERLGILGVIGDPTNEQIALAMSEASRDVAAIYQSELHARVAKGYG